MKVGTFYAPREGFYPARSRIHAYTRWYSTEWDGCIEYDIPTTSGKEAKRLATDLRLAHENGKLFFLPRDVRGLGT